VEEDVSEEEQGNKERNDAEERATVDATVIEEAEEEEFGEVCIGREKRVLRFFSDCLTRFESCLYNEGREGHEKEESETSTEEEGPDDSSTEEEGVEEETSGAR
jgi:hypothetical protein